MTARRRRPAARKTRPAHKSRPTRKTAAGKTTPRKTGAAPKTTAVDIGAEVARLGTTLAGETDFAKCLDHLLTAARRVTGAEAGTVYVRRGDMLEFAAVQNEVLERRIGAEEMRKRLAARPLSLSDPSIASYVVLTRATVNLGDSYEIPMDRPYTLFREVDRKADYRTRSMLATPLRDAHGRVFGVLQLINAVDAEGKVVAFSSDHQALVQTLAALAAQIQVRIPTS